MASWRAAGRLGRLLLHGLHGLALVLWRFPRLDRAGREERIRWWSARLFERLGIELSVDGAPVEGGVLLVANHVSWLDIMAVHATVPRARFVAKSEVKSWPLVSQLVGAAGTLYLERGRKRDAMRVVHLMADALRAGEMVAVFPEGTTSDGQGLLPLHANLLQAAISAHVPVQPLVLRYSDPRHAVSPAAVYIGDTSLWESMRLIAGAQELRLRVRYLPPEPADGAERRALAATLAARMARELDALG